MRAARPSALHVSVFSRYNMLPIAIRQQGTAGFASAGWVSNNRALYVPIYMPSRFTVARFFTANGAVVSGSFDAGLYDAEGNRLLNTTATLQAGASVVQYVDVTNSSFPAGSYYLALVHSTTAGRFQRTTFDTLQSVQMCGVLQEALGGTALPATMTPAAMADASVYNWGFTQSDTL